MFDKPFNLDRTVRLCITVALAILLYYLSRQLSSVLLPFIISWFFAYLLHPIVNLCQRYLHIRNRAIAVFLTLLIVVGLLVLLIFLLSGPIKAQVNKTTTLVTAYVSGLDANTLLPEHLQDMIREWIAQVDLRSLLTGENISKAINKIAPYVGGVIGGSISFVSSMFIIFVCVLYLIFILIDYDAISSGMREIVPPKYRELIYGILNDLETGMNKYFRGQAMVASSVGVLFAIGFSIMGLPLGIIVGLFIGVLNMVPYMQALGIPVCMLLGILQSADTGTSYWVILLEIAAVFIVVQSIQDLVLNPLIMGNVIGMKPAVMLLALSIWGSLLGVAGMIIALPLTTVLISYYKRFVLKEDSSPAQKAPAESVDIPVTEQKAPVND